MKNIDSKSFQLFLDLCTYYLCTSCETTTSRWHPKPSITMADDPYQFHHAGHVVKALRQFGPDDNERVVHTLLGIFAKFGGKRQNYEQLFVSGLKDDIYSDFSCADYEIVSYFYNHRETVFIFHGPETISVDNIDTKFYPFNNLVRDYSFIDTKRQYAINTDFPPFEICRKHFDKSLLNSIFPWNYFAGYVALTDFENSGGKLCKLDDREHFYAEGAIDISNWYFISDFHSMDRYIQQYNNSRLAKVSPLEFSALQMREFADFVHSAGGKTIDVQIILKYFHLLDLLRQKLIILDSNAFIK